MTDISQGWGRGPSGRYDALANRFRPIFAEIAAGAADRDRERRLPFAEVRRLREAGYAALRIPEDYGGSGCTLPELFALMIELGAAVAGRKPAPIGESATISPFGTNAGGS